MHMWVWVCMCLCLYKTHSLQTRRASASFSCGCLCVTSPVNPAGKSFYTAALTTPHFPTQHAAYPLCSCTPHKTSPDIVLYVCASARKHIKGYMHTHKFSHKPPHTCTQASEKYTRCRPSVGAVGDKGRRITGGPWGAEQVICLKHDQTEHTPT